MKRYLEYLTTRADNYIVAYGLGDWFDLGPKHPGYSQLTSNGVTSTGVYYYNATILSQIQNCLEKKRMKNTLRNWLLASGRLIMKNFIILLVGSMIATVRQRMQYLYILVWWKNLTGKLYIKI